MVFCTVRSGTFHLERGEGLERGGRGEEVVGEGGEKRR